MAVSTLDFQAGDAPFTKNPKESYTLPARFYFDGDIYNAEKEAIFYSSWLYAGHKSQVAEAGAYFTVKIHEQNVFVVRDKSGEINAFYNVCQHRGHELLEGAGKTSNIVCPYHAWAYGFDGELIAARNSQRVQGFNKCEFALKRVQIEDFCGMLFVNLDPDAPSLRSQTGELENEIRKLCPRVDELQYAQRDTFDVACNWKTIVDNFLECYHCHVAHKDFVDLVDMNSYRTKTYDIYSAQISGAARSNENSAFKFETGDVDFGYAGWFLWPNLTIWLYPGDANLSVLQMNPAEEERTIEFQDWFVLDGQPTDQLCEAMAYQKDVLQPEDIALCTSVQKGLKSRGYNQGRFIVDEELSELSEHAVHHFQSLVMRALDVEMS
ncbi:MAG: aromatic ring-hydroxylating dioxygenase subunit alpha [Pseudomonadota bacterium]